MFVLSTGVAPAACRATIATCPNRSCSSKSFDPTVTLAPLRASIFWIDPLFTSPALSLLTAQPDTVTATSARSAAGRTRRSRFLRFILFSSLIAVRDFVQKVRGTYLRRGRPTTGWSKAPRSQHVLGDAAEPVGGQREHGGEDSVGQAQSWPVQLDTGHQPPTEATSVCLLYTSDAADEEDSVDLGGRSI